MGQHGVLLLVYQSADPVTPLTGNTVAAQWRDLVSVEEEGTGQGGSGSEDDHMKLLVNLMDTIKI